MQKYYDKDKATTSGLKLANDCLCVKYMVLTTLLVSKTRQTIDLLEWCSDYSRRVEKSSIVVPSAKQDESLFFLFLLIFFNLTKTEQ